jgi:adenine-specific DNA-methyltransferase
MPTGFPCSEETLSYPKKVVDEDFFEQTRRDKYISDEVKEKYGIENKSGLPVKLDEMTVENFRLKRPCRIYVGMANRNKLIEFIENDCAPINDNGALLRFYINPNCAVRYHKENESPRNILSVLKGMGTTEKSKTALKKLGIYYDYPKPIALIDYLISIGAESVDSIILDFFAGSGTTGHAVMTRNASDDGSRRYILVQLPELLDLDKKSQKIAAEVCDKLGKPKNLAELTKERLRQVAENIEEEHPNWNGDTGFRVFKLDGSNIRAWDPEPEDLERTLLDNIEHVKDGRSAEDVLYELLLKLGLDLCVPVENRTITDKTVYSIGAGTLIACLDESIPAATVEPLALGIAAWHKELDPLGESTVVFRDSAFANDVAKTNLTAILQQHGLENVRSL